MPLLRTSKLTEAELLSLARDPIPVLLRRVAGCDQPLPVPRWPGDGPVVVPGGRDGKVPVHAFDDDPIA